MDKGEPAVFTLDKTKMPRCRRLFQLLLFAVFVLYMGLLFYHNYYSRGSLSQQVTSWEGVDGLRMEVAKLGWRENGELLLVPLKGRPLLKKHIFERTLSQQPSINDQYENGLSTEVSSATATIRPPATTLDDVFISVKTTKSYHSSRLPIILKTWFQLAKRQTWFFTDTDDEEFQLKTNGHMINTNCSSSHNRKALCCKMSVEFDTFLNTDKK
ncbi:hypothetical protein YQE_08427, partial [Dendroctonus ponderosae]